MGPKVIGLLTSVLTIAAGTLARSTTALATESGICAIGMSRPKNTPSATPVATPRRDQCHSLVWCSQGPNQPSQRLPASCAGVGRRVRSLSIQRIHMALMLRRRSTVFSSSTAKNFKSPKAKMTDHEMASSAAV